ncbi:GNAT family N-acetyltransferase [Labrenzia sp. THAF82]|uniref:GNAT family N-acetyltransferase n=1 Tax=Labrenzia sp. THAF82 TaxID=2587861 RepID=UPI001267E0BD|nr:GNAT family N-acetyltransferase [Labrenzia sp. THAF82]
MSPRPKSNMTVRLANGSESDCRAGVFLAQEAHRNTIFRDIPFSEDKARAVFEKAIAEPGRFGLIYAVPSDDELLSEDGLHGFASVHAGEYFLGTGALIATVQTLNISRRLTGTMLGGKVALRLVQAVRHWAKERGCAHFMVHVTNGDNAEEADRFFRRCGMVTVGGNYLS